MYNYNIDYQINNTVSLYHILTSKISSDTHFVFFCLLLSPVDVSLIRLQSSQPTYCDSIFHCTSFQLGKCLDGNFRHLHRRRFQCFQETNPNRNAEYEVSKTYCTPHHCMMKLAPVQFHCNFPIFYCLESFCRSIQMPSRLFFM